MTEANLMAMHAETGVYNVSGYPSSVIGMANSFQTQSKGLEKPIITGESFRPGGEYSLTSNSKKIHEACGWEPTVRLGSQIEDFLKFAERGGAHGS